MMRHLQAVLHPTLGLALFWFCLSCKKETVSQPAAPLPDHNAAAGLSPEYFSVSGFLYAQTTETTISYPPVKTYWQINGFGIFSDPPANLCGSIDPLTNYLTVWAQAGNLNTGVVSMNEFPLTWTEYPPQDIKAGYYTGQPFTAHPPDTAITWQVPGNSALPGFSDHFIQPFASLQPDFPKKLTLNRGVDLIIRPVDFFSAYDSIYVTIQKLGSKNLKPGTTEVMFDGEYLSSAYFGIDSIPFYIKAFRYYHAKHSGKNYQYLFVTSLPVSLIFKND